MTATTAPTGIAKYIPILGWLPDYQSGWLRFDLVAGLTAAAVVIPQAMAYATIAGLPILAREAAELEAAAARVGRNHLCPCGSCLKTKQCHGRKRAETIPQPQSLPVHQAQPRARVVTVSKYWYESKA